MATKTNINLIVAGSKVYTRKTTGRPYTHALVMNSTNGWSIVSCSSKGTAALQRWISDADQALNWYRATVAAGPTEYHTADCIETYKTRIEEHEATLFYIVEIIDNTVTITNESEATKGGRA